jgi:hypothetical protein
MSLVFVTSYFTVFPGHMRDNRESKIFLSAAQGSRDEKIGECV